MSFVDVPDGVASTDNPEWLLPLISFIFNTWRYITPFVRPVCTNAFAVPSYTLLPLHTGEVCLVEQDNVYKIEPGAPFQLNVIVPLPVSAVIDPGPMSPRSPVNAT